MTVGTFWVRDERTNQLQAGDPRRIRMTGMSESSAYVPGLIGEWPATFVFRPKVYTLHVHIYSSQSICINVQIACRASIRRLLIAALPRFPASGHYLLAKFS